MNEKLTAEQREIIDWIKKQSFSKFADEYIVNTEKLEEYLTAHTEPEDEVTQTKEGRLLRTLELILDEQGITGVAKAEILTKMAKTAQGHAVAISKFHTWDTEPEDECDDYLIWAKGKTENKIALRKIEEYIVCYIKDNHAYGKTCPLEWHLVMDSILDWLQEDK